MFDRKTHWEKIYSGKKPTEVSWFQENPGKSLDLIKQTGIPLDAGIIDVGGGATLLTDRLLDAGFKDLTVLDISAIALERAQERLGDRADQAKWVVSDITQYKPSGKFDLWHDRAVFHFLTEEADRRKYAALAGRAVKPGGHLILASFALDGPDKCSNLTVCRYDGELIQRELGTDFKLVREDSESHLTPWKKEQKFRYFLFNRR